MGTFLKDGTEQPHYQQISDTIHSLNIESDFSPTVSNPVDGILAIRCEGYGGESYWFWNNPDGEWSASEFDAKTCRGTGRILCPEGLDGEADVYIIAKTIIAEMRERWRLARLALDRQGHHSQ